MPDPGPPPTPTTPALLREVGAWLLSIGLSAPLGYGIPAVVSWSLHNDLLALGALLVLSGPTLLLATWLDQRIRHRPRHPWPRPGPIVSGCAAPFVWYLVVVVLTNSSIMDCRIVECGNKRVLWGTIGGLWGSGMFAYLFLIRAIQRTRR